MHIIVSSNQLWLGSKSVLPLLDLPFLLQAAAIRVKQKAESAALSVEAGQLQSVGPAFIPETSSDDVTARGVNFHSDGGICDTSSSSEGQKGFDAKSIPPLENMELKRVFQKFDENQDDMICAGDLRRYMSRLGLEVSEEEAVEMLKTVDHDGDGKVGFEEFCTLYRSLDEGGDGPGKLEVADADEDEESLLEAFKVFDKNNDGYITCQELQSVLLALGLQEGQSLRSCERMIQGVDLDGNGEVDIMEFRQMMSSDILMS
ncbi:calcium-binding protein CML [Marchantia polymorpha subsp. ruderalis]|uniref:EF-hand domain-containing protein n=2 Tax=Marchantia polymorpha TaxID=3197 RepID=A0AAF6BU65_MARPO|nr:hypothetical protein MARPO_0045s0017 [Marchantia polymorpha]BBN15549.1 hypothetical protein Mp_6g20470 [Marchantia polymorpha subsp. ruderalis]|eukprot:PTQ39340.1 hypothetical protein MARPO_0045s0017 [Marchantia polymorpha]